MINARSETLDEKPAYRDAFRKRRCVVPASGFYEWKKTPDGKIPHYIFPADGELFSFAGLYEHWEGDKKPIDSFTILTTLANKAINPLHDRMPAMLFGKEIDQWLDPENNQPGKLLGPAPNDAIKFYQVSTRVNYPGNDSADLIEKV